MDQAQSSNWGFLRGVLDRIRGTLRPRELELSTFEPDVVGSMFRRDRLVALLRNKRRSCGGDEKGEIRPGCPVIQSERPAGIQNGNPAAMFANFSL